MGGRHADERAGAWARALSELQRARGVLVVEKGAVRKAEPALLSPRDFLGEDLRTPPGAVMVDHEMLLRLRAAISTISHARDLDALIAQRHPRLRRWRGRDLTALVGEATGFAEAVAWALGAAGGHLRAARPPGVVVVGDDRTGFEVAGFPDVGVGSVVIDADRRVAGRLRAVEGVELARRWLVTAAERWWPPPAVVETIEGFARRAEHAAAPSEVAAIVAEAVECLRDELLPVRLRRLRKVRTRGELFAALGELFDTAAYLRQAEVVGFEAVAEAGDGLSLQDEWVEGLRSRAGQDRELCLSVLRLTPQGRFGIPPHASPRAVRSILRLLEEADRKWVCGAGEIVREWLQADLRLDPWLAGQPPAVAGQVAVCWPVLEPIKGWRTSDLRAYLRVLDAAGDPGSPAGAWLRQWWVVQLAGSELAPGALSLLYAVGRAEAGAEAAVMALAAHLLPGRQDLKAAMREWANPATLEVDTRALSAAVGLDETLLREYLHYRRLAGDRERLPKSLRTLVDAGHDHQQRVAAIEALLAAGGIGEGREVVLRGELARLADPGVHAGRCDALRRQARKQIERATASYRLVSLRRLLEGYARRQLPDLPAGVPMALLADVVRLCGDDRVDSDALGRFLADPTAEAVAGWKENTRWVERQRDSFDVERWLDGFSETRSVAGSAVRYRVEREPVMAIHMGTWFDTCLSVHDGMNRYSALINAVEANRHVVYGIDTSGNVIARKLIAVSSTGGLLGYRTYARRDQHDHRRALGAVCEAFAHHCGLVLSDVGRPESLLGADWYDDGTEPWSSPTVPDVPEGPAHRDVPEDTAHRDLLGNQQVARVVFTCYNHDLLCGLLLDGRITPGAIVAHYFEHDCDSGDCTRAAMLIDPSGVGGALRRPPSGAQIPLFDVPASREAVSAVARAGLPLDDSLLLLLPVGEALDYLSTTAEDFPSELTVRVLRRRGAAPRALQRAVNSAVGRSQAKAERDHVRLNAAQFAVERAAALRLVAASDSQLRRMLAGNCAAAVAAAHELAVRGSAASAQAVHEAARRWPRNPRLVAAAAALGRGLPDAEMADWDDVSVSDAILLRLAVAQGMSTEGLRRSLIGVSGGSSQSWSQRADRLQELLKLLAQVGPDCVGQLADGMARQLRPPECQELDLTLLLKEYELFLSQRKADQRMPVRLMEGHCRAVRQIDPAVAAAQRGEWGQLSVIADQAPTLLADPRIIELVIDAMSSDDQQLSGCASMFAQARLAFVTWEVRELASVVFAEVAARATLGEHLAHAVAAAYFGFSPPFLGLADGVVAALAAGLAPKARLRLLTITSEVKSQPHFGSNLAWSLAAWVRRDPKMLEDAPNLTVPGVAILIDSLARTFPACEFARLAKQVLDSLQPADARSVIAMLSKDPDSERTWDRCRWQPAAQELAVSWSTPTSPSGGATVKGSSGSDTPAQQWGSHRR